MLKSNNRKISSDSQQTDPIQAAVDYGIDVSMLKDNLKRSPSERIRRHRIALNTFRALSKAKRL